MQKHNDKLAISEPVLKTYLKNKRITERDLVKILKNEPEEIKDAIYQITKEFEETKELNKLFKLNVMFREGKTSFLSVLATCKPKVLKLIYEGLNWDNDDEVTKISDVIKNQKGVLHNWIDHLIAEATTYNVVKLSSKAQIFNADPRYFGVSREPVANKTYYTIYQKYDNVLDDNGIYKYSLKVSSSRAGGIQVTINSDNHGSNHATQNKDGGWDVPFDNCPITQLITEEIENLESIFGKIDLKLTKKVINVFQYLFEKIQTVKDNDKIKILLQKTLESCLKSEYLQKFTELLKQVDYKDIENDAIKEVVGKFAVENNIVELKHFAKSNQDEEKEQFEDENEIKEDEIKKDSKEKPPANNDSVPSNAASSDNVVKDILNNNNNGDNVEPEVTITGDNVNPDNNQNNGGDAVT